MLLAIVVSIAVILGWQFLIVPNFFPPAPPPAPQATAPSPSGGH